jgi:hypothetical protein
VATTGGLHILPACDPVAASTIAVPTVAQVLSRLPEEYDRRLLRIENRERWGNAVLRSDAVRRDPHNLAGRRDRARPAVEGGGHK